MAEGKNRNLSGDYTDSRNFDAYSPENQQYLRDHSQSTVDGVPIEKLENKEDGFLGSFRKRKDPEGNTKWGIGRDDLKDAEASASKDPNASGRGGDKSASLGEKEKNVEGDNESLGGKIRNSVKGVAAAKRGDIGGAIKGIKSAGPLVTILGAIVLFIGVCFLGQMSLPFSFMSLLQGNFDSMSVGLMVRTNNTLRWQLRPSTRQVSTEADNFVKQHSKIYQKFTGANENYYSLSSAQQRRLRNAGIDLVADADTGEKVLQFKRGNGELATVTADDFKNQLKADTEFNNKFQEGTKTWRKSVAHWFDERTKGFLDKIKVFRNRLKDYITGEDSKKNKEDFEGIVKNAEGDGDINGRTTGTELEEETSTDRSGNTTTTRSIADGDEVELRIAKGQKAAEVSEALQTFGETKGAKISRAAGQLANGICTASELAAAINMLVVASEAAQILQVSSTIFEGVQKAQAGDGSGSPINEIGNSLTQTKTTQYNTADDEVVEKTGSAMSAAAVTALYGNTAVDTSDPSVNSFNLTDSTNKVMSAIGGGLDAYRNCTIARIGAGLVDAALDGVDIYAKGAEIASCILLGAETFGAACGPLIGHTLVTVIGQISASVALAAIVANIVQFFTPKIVTMLARDLATDIGGEDFGNAIVSGANMYMGQNHQYGGGSVASRDTLMAYYNQQQEYLAEQARYDRQTRSPFDASSPNTFLGSLLARSAPLLTQTSSITSGINNFSNATRNAFASIMPNASAMTSAVTAQQAAENTKYNCPELDSIGAVGDAFCNPYFITDFSTMGVDPAEVTYKVSQLSDGNNFDLTNENEDIPTINESKESKLYKYIVFCGQRSATTFGKPDQNIANSVADNPSSFESALPVWGGISDIVHNETVLKNFGYISGKACVTQNDGSGLSVTGNTEDGDNVFTWDEAKYYQRFIEDQRLLESEGKVAKSSVTIALEHYYEKNPIDDSFEGVLAHYSGLSKENVIAALDFMEAMVWIAEYDPSGLYQFGDSEPLFNEDDEKEAAPNIEFSEEKTDYAKPAVIGYRKEYYTC